MFATQATITTSLSNWAVGLKLNQEKGYGNAITTSTFPVFTAPTLPILRIGCRRRVPLPVKFGGKHSDRSVWGPAALPGGINSSLADFPPTAYPDQDSYSWGVGEDADLITLLPLFPPHETHYAFLGDFWNYPKAPPAPEPPKRCSIVTTYRLSNRLLNTMHIENSKAPGHHMGSEMWPPSVCLQYGYKAVYAPHPIWLDRKWPARALDYIFNPGPGGYAGGSESVFGLDREHNFLGSTWYYRADWARSLYWRFLGWEAKGIGGKEVSHRCFLMCQSLRKPASCLVPPAC